MKKALLFLALIAATLTIQAGVVLSDDFSYPDGGVVTNSTWFDNSNAANATPALVSNQTLIVTSQRSQDIVNPLTGGPYMTNGPIAALYSRYTLRCTFRPTASGSYFSHFTATNTFGLSGFRARLYASTTATGNVAPAGQFWLSIVNSLSSATPVPWPTPLETNVNYTVVTRIVLATGESTLWINPTSESDSGVTGTDVLPYEESGIPTNGVANISHYSFRQASGIGTMLIDEFRVGTSFNDVVGQNTSPTISAIASQSLPSNASVGPIPFTVEDGESAPEALTVSASSDNKLLVPDANIVLSGVGSTRTVTITPSTGQQGTARITLTVSDGVNTSPTSFTVKVGFPGITDVSDLVISPGSSGSTSFTVSDSETPASALTIDAVAADESLIPQSAMVINGTGATRTIVITAQPGVTGSTRVTLTVSDGANSSATDFLVVFPPATGIVLTDTFDYVDGALWLQGPWQTHANPTGTNFSQLQVTNKMAELSESHAEDLAADLIGAPYLASSGAIFYVGLKLVFTALPSRTGDYFLHFKDTAMGTSFRGKLFASTANASTNHYRLSISNGANSPSSEFPIDLALNKTYGVVFVYNTALGQTALWVNPASVASPSVIATDSTSVTAVGAFGLRQSGGIGTNYVDSLVISSSFADVNPGISSPTPVPLQVQRNGQSLVISWSNPALKLQSAPAISGPWSAVPNATSPHTVPAATGSAFFRLTE